MYRHQWVQEQARRRRLAVEAARQRAAIERPLQIIPSQPEPISDDPITGLGRLAILPNEIIMIVFDNCSLRSLLRLERVNKAAKKFVSLLHDIVFVRETAQGIIQRAVPQFRTIMFTILKITTYHGLRQLLATYTCETCGKPGSFRMVKVKVLCDECNTSRKLKDR
ncbi:hypothetical protein K449DRAFT_258445 [Hypoxylon sp. EC38]|nr:hypothetical protein K449DRAFT_258445 [Hypoxylon sp. EC38]OTA90070.1 hypothetical protein M434DRAFT_14187 [Hypoxylon sp. CO27-5]